MKGDALNIAGKEHGAPAKIVEGGALIARKAREGIRICHGSKKGGPDRAHTLPHPARGFPARAVARGLPRLGLAFAQE